MNPKENDKLAHDLRTPVSTIRGYASMLLEGIYGQLTKESAEAVQKIVHASDEMAELIEKNCTHN